jgi:uncharacterized membrane protein YeaQ/YmgE (transglycosylase-associated protein family)
MGIMGLVKLIIVGLIVGAIARWIMPGAQAIDLVRTCVIGVGGSLLGGFVSNLLWPSPHGQFHPAGWIMSIAGALVVLYGYMQYIH